jgi:hypothetical protein
MRSPAASLSASARRAAGQAALPDVEAPRRPGRRRQSSASGAAIARRARRPLFVAATLLAGLAPAGAGTFYVKVCSVYGAGFLAIPGTDICLNSDTGETRQATSIGVKYDLSGLAGRVGVLEGQTANLTNAYQALQARFDADFRDAKDGSAIAAAMQDPDLEGSEHFAVKFNWGTYLGSNAIGATFAGVLGQFSGVRTTAVGGVAFTGSNVGGQAGVQFTW